MATTIMISTSVKPGLRDVFVFFIVRIVLIQARREQCNKRVTIITVLFTNCLLQPT
jgi:hypothetical protein